MLVVSRFEPLLTCLYDMRARNTEVVYQMELPQAELKKHQEPGASSKSRHSVLFNKNLFVV